MGTDEGSRGGRRLRTFAKAGLARTVAKVRGFFAHEPGEVLPVDEAELASARVLAEEAGQLRGGMAKVAQLMGYAAGPGAATDGEARRALGALWDRLPEADWQGVRTVLTEELGGPPEERFARFDPTPLAAASLGQVHAATTHDGHEVAVKVQYPGVAEALASDLASKALLERLTGAAVGGALPAESLEALRQAVLAELDYRQEAEALTAFAAAFAHDAQIVVPRLEPALSTGRVLTAERLSGQRLPELAGAAPEVRAQVAATLFRFHWSAALEHGLLNADPNPGNYLVLDAAAGKVGFLDFGCAQTLEPALVEEDRRLFYAALRNDGESFRHAIVGEGLLKKATVLDSDTFRTWERFVSAPFKKGTRFTWTRAYAQKLARVTSDLVRAGGVTLPPKSLLLWRQRLGLAAVLGDLEPTADFRTVLETIVARVPRPRTRSRDW